MTTTINKEEIQKFSRLAEEWWDVKGNESIYMFNPIRIEYIVDNCSSHFNLKRIANFLLKILKSRYWMRRRVN